MASEQIERRYFDANVEPFELTLTRHPENRFSFNMELRSIEKSQTARATFGSHFANHTALWRYNALF
jgi:hypothetical protein